MPMSLLFGGQWPLINLPRAAEAFVAVAARFRFDCRVAALFAAADLLLRVETFENQLAGRAQHVRLPAVAEVRLFGGGEQPVNRAKAFQTKRRAVRVTDPQRAAV